MYYTVMVGTDNHYVFRVVVCCEGEGLNVMRFTYVNAIHFNCSCSTYLATEFIQSFKRLLNFRVEYAVPGFFYCFDNMSRAVLAVYYSL